MTLKNDEKLEAELTCRFKIALDNDMINLANFHESTEKSQNWDYDETLLPKVENV